MQKSESGKEVLHSFTLPLISVCPRSVRFRPPSAPETKKGPEKSHGSTTTVHKGSKCLYWEIKPNRQNQRYIKIFQNVFTNGLSATGRFSRLLQKSVSGSFNGKHPLFSRELRIQVPKNPAVGPGSLKFSDPRARPRSLYIFGGWCVCRESFRPKRKIRQ